MTPITLDEIKAAQDHVADLISKYEAAAAAPAPVAPLDAMVQKAWGRFEAAMAAVAESEKRAAPAPVAPPEEEEVRAAHRAAEESGQLRHHTRWQLWRDAVEWVVARDAALTAAPAPAAPAGSVDVLIEALDWCVAEINRDTPACINGRAVLEAVKSAPAPVAHGEPVAWLYDWHADGAIVRDWLTKSRDEAHNERTGCHNIRPLYAAPAPVAPLNQMQIIALWGPRSDGPDNAEIVSFAHAIERAHGIKGAE